MKWSLAGPELPGTSRSSGPANSESTSTSV